jgi:hypothetical protein
MVRNTVTLYIGKNGTEVLTRGRDGIRHERLLTFAQANRIAYRVDVLAFEGKGIVSPQATGWVFYLKNEAI